MTKEMDLLNVEIEKTKVTINDTSVGISLLGVFLLALIPLFYSIMGMYNFTFDNIQMPLIIAMAIIFSATMLAILHWEQNTQKLKKLYEQKIVMINTVEIKVETPQNLNKKNRKKN